MVSNTRDRNIDSSRREDSRKGQVDRCEVINVRPHVRPYPADKDFNTVDVQLIDRPRIEGEPLTIEYVKLNSLQRHHGLFQGHPWNPRIGDMIYVYWLAEREALVLGICTSIEQEPLCRSKADDQQQEFVFKLSPWEEPGKNQDGNYVSFPPPKHPTCWKWWPKTRDFIWIFDCKNGHDCASCDRTAPCNGLDDLIARTYFKIFSDISNTIKDKIWRFKFHHNSGSVLVFDNDGSVHLENKTQCSTCGGSGCSGTCSTCGGTGLVDDELCPACGGCGQLACSSCGGDGGDGKGHSHHYPSGSSDIHAGNPHPCKDFIPLASEDNGVRVAVSHPDDATVDFAAEIKQFSTGAYIKILKNGDIKVYSPGKITLDAPTTDITGDLHVYQDEQVDGACSGPNNVL